MATIYKRKKIWYIDYRIDGKRVRRKIGPSKKVAEIELKNIEVKLSKGEALLHESKTCAPLLLTNNSIQPHTTKVHPFRASDSG